MLFNTAKSAWIYLLACCLLLVTPSAAVATESVLEKEHRVLVLNSYNKGYRWTDKEVEGIEEVFSALENAELRIEYMDAKQVQRPDYDTLVRLVYAFKYGDAQFDVVIATDDAALRLLNTYRDELFPGVPVVFCGVNDFTPEELAALSNMSGVNDITDFTPDVDLILKLHPENPVSLYHRRWHQQQAAASGIRQSHRQIP